MKLLKNRVLNENGRLEEEKRRKGEWKKKCGTRNGPRPIYDHDSVISPKYWIARGVITGDGHRLKQLAPVLIIWFFSDNCAIIGPIPFTWTSVGLASKIPVWVKCRRRSFNWVGFPGSFHRLAGQQPHVELLIEINMRASSDLLDTAEYLREGFMI